MTRKKVKLTWIVNDSARRASLKKRRVGLLKKVSELTILCGVEAFVIIYSPDDPEPTVWPSRPKVLQLLTRFQNMPDMERYKKMVNQETYLKERMGKLNEQSWKHRKNNRELEMAGLMEQVHRDKGFDGLDHTQLCGLAWLVKEKRKEIRKRIGYLEQIPSLQLGAFPPGPFPFPFHYQDLDKDDGGDYDGTSVQAGGEPRYGRKNPTDGGASWDQWFTDKINNPEDSVAGGSSAGMTWGCHIHLTLLVEGDLILDIRGGHNFDLGQLPREYESLRGSSSAGGNNFDPGLLLGSNMAGGNLGDSFDPWLPSDLGFNPGGNKSVELNFDLGLHQGHSTGGNNFDLWLPHENNTGGDSAVMNHVDTWLARGDMGGENLGLGLLPGSNLAGSSAAGNHFHSRDGSGDGAGSASGSNSGLPGSFGAGSSDHIEQPFDVTKSWPSNNFNP
ncbi:MADS-box family protein [Salix suchowensis]|nr:MADS-box family protein [Salix suchowensis]